MGVLMRFGILAAGCVFGLMAVGVSAQSAPNCADLKLVPAVRECKDVTVLHLHGGGVTVFAANDSEDKFSVRAVALNKGIGHPAVVPDRVSILLERAG